MCTSPRRGQPISGVKMHTSMLLVNVSPVKLMGSENVRNGSSCIFESKETKTSSWFNRFIGLAKKPEMTWPFPFSEGKMSVLNHDDILTVLIVHPCGECTLFSSLCPGMQSAKILEYDLDTHLHSMEMIALSSSVWSI
ncbi:unnamed protein product [Urochloa humidicola]